MGLFFTLVFIVASFLSPDTLFGDLAQYHIVLFIAGLALLFAIASASGSDVLKMQQAPALFGLFGAVIMSQLATGWFGGAAQAFFEFLPSVATFFIIFLCCRKRRHLRLLTATLFLCACFIVFMAVWALHRGDDESPYLLVHMQADYFELIRIRGLSFLSDPNDLAQFLATLIPCMFFFWGKGKGGRNLALVYLPVAFLVYGMYLTHSRGGMMALMAMCIVAARRRIGVIPAAVIGAVAFVGMSAIGFAGGRDVTQGEDRIALWSDGLGIIRSHPLFGVGFNRFGEHIDSGMTAHNTFVVCAGELGFVGVFFWVMVILVTMRNLYLLTSPKADAPAEAAEVENRQAVPRQAMARVRERAPAQLMARDAAFAGGSSAMLMAPSFVNAPNSAAAGAPFGFAQPDPDAEVDGAEVRRMASLMMTCMTGFLVAGWFLSRPFALNLYVYVGMAAAVYKMALDRGIAPPQLSAARAAKLSGLICLALFFMVYLIVRVDHFLPH